MRKTKIVVAIVVVTFSLILLSIRLNKENLINKNPAYVIGLVIEKESLENGFGYTCKYYYNNKSYTAEFTDIRPANDSLIFFKISRDYPSKWKYIELDRVPRCFKFSDVPELGWAKLPTCDSLK